MDAPKCRLCHTRHWGNCPGTAGDTVESVTKTPKPVKTRVAAVKTETTPVKTPVKTETQPVKTGFDKKAWMKDYMREYMRQRRAKTKAKETHP